MEHLSKLINFPKGPFRLPIIGNLHLLSKKLHEDLKQITDVYGDVFSLSFGMKTTFIVSYAEKAKAALVTKGPQFGGKPQDICTTKLMKYDLILNWK